VNPARERLLAVALCVVGAGLVLLALSQQWARAVVAEEGFPRVVVEASGRDVAAAAAGLALVALAGAVALFVVRAVGRVVTGVVLVLAGAGIVAQAIAVATDLAAAVEPLVADAVGRTGAAPESLDGSPFPWITVVGGLLVVAGGLLAVVRGRRWPGGARRYEAAPTPDAARPAPARGSAEDADALWKALDRGEDPTDPDRSTT
jgi:uncharacterized membrane protein (TIGR02234 family)